MKLNSNNLLDNNTSIHNKYYGILVSCNPGSIFDYKYQTNIPLGTIVKVPFGKKMVLGCVWENKTNISNKYKTKTIDVVFSNLVLEEKTILFIKWMAKYTVSQLGNILKMVAPSFVLLEKKPKMYLIKNKNFLYKKLSSQRQKVMELVDNKEMTIKEIIHSTDVDRGLIKRMIKDKNLMERISKEKFFTTNNQVKKEKVLLNPEQQKAFDIIELEMKKTNPQPVFLDGITGSGKTEVYFKLIEKNSIINLQTLVMLPEIALSKQWLSRFEERFGFVPLVWNSSLSLKRKKNIWESILKSEVDVIVGTRSSLLLPFKNLGLIILDEEHDSSYKQEEGVIYNARDMAIVKAKISQAQIVLVSATPSIETYNNVKVGKYKRVMIKNRYGISKLPSSFLIDMKKDILAKEGKWISERAIKEVAEALSKNEQSLVFINRRGYAPLSLCKECGYRYSCNNCDAWLVYHQSKNLLQCHHCNYQTKLPKYCKNCKKKDTLIPYGPGVERIAEEVRGIFSESNIEIVSSDTSNNEKFSNILKRIEKNDINIIIGTQVIAKGYDFPNITKVIIVDFDLSLYGGDLRAGEKTYQLISQVSGRAGRGEKHGKVFIQTYDTENSIIKALLKGDRDDFLERELSFRKVSNLPPYGKLVSIIIYGLDKSKVEKTSNNVKKYFNKHEITALGPAPSPIPFLRNNYRFRLLLKIKLSFNVQNYLSKLPNDIALETGVKLKIDIDPYNFL